MFYMITSEIRYKIVSWLIGSTWTYFKEHSEAKKINKQTNPNIDETSSRLKP